MNKTQTTYSQATAAHETVELAKAVKCRPSNRPAILRRLYTTTALNTINALGETAARLSFDNWFLVDSFRRRFASSQIDFG